MALLLDTHVWVWSQAQPEELGPGVQQALTDPTAAIYVATVSTLELSRFVMLGRLELFAGVDDWVSASLDLLGARTIELSHAIALGAYQLPGSFHRDPADRIIVATAREHGLTLVTADERILSYPHVETRNARS